MSVNWSDFIPHGEHLVRVEPQLDGTIVVQTYEREPNPAKRVLVVLFWVLAGAAVLVAIFVAPFAGAALFAFVAVGFTIARNRVPSYRPGAPVTKEIIQLPRLDADAGTDSTRIIQETGSDGPYAGPSLLLS